MKRQKQSTTFQFVLNNQQVFNNLDHIKMNNYERFIAIGEAGKEIQALSKADQPQQLQKFIDEHSIDIPFMKLEIEDAFTSAFHLRNQGVIEYYLKNGINMDQIIPDAVISVCYCLEYLFHDPPVDFLKLILEFGGNSRYAEPQNSDTPIHIACKYGNLEFVKLLAEHGCDINAVNYEKMTPLGTAMQHKKGDVIQYLKGLKAREKWNQ